jgi:hypothetical protein
MGLSRLAAASIVGKYNTKIAFPNTIPPEEAFDAWRETCMNRFDMHLQQGEGSLRLRP